MHHYLKEFTEYFENEDKEKCVSFAMDKLHRNELDIKTLYEDILGPSLNSIGTCPENSRDCVWREHLKTSIVRTIIECCYPFIINMRGKEKKLNLKVLIFCPENENHEIGARMAADFFTLHGYDAVFLGSCTPRDQVKLALECHKPHYAALSVTDYFNLVAAKKSVQAIREFLGSSVKIIAGGRAFLSNMDIVPSMGADMYLATYDDIKRLSEEDYKNAAFI